MVMPSFIAVTLRVIFATTPYALRRFHCFSLFFALRLLYLRGVPLSPRLYDTLSRFVSPADAHYYAAIFSTRHTLSLRCLFRTFRHAFDITLNLFTAYIYL